MAGATLPNTGITLPELGADAGTWDDVNNACWENYDEHDHSPGSGVQIPTAGIDIDADLSFNGFGLEDVGTLEFVAVPALATGAVTLFVNDADDELYWRTNAGVNVKLTAGASINTSLIGGIAGDYSTVGAELAYDAANNRYTFKDGTSPSKLWSRLASGSVRIYETGTAETVYVGINTPAALASSYDITLPVALPASTAFLMIDAAGQVAFTASPVLATNANITLSGTGSIKHGARRKTQAFVPGATTAGSFATGADGLGGLTPCLLAASSTVYADVKGLHQSDTVSAITVRGVRASGVGDITYDVFWARPSLGPSFTSLLAAPVVTAADDATLTFTAPFLVVAGDNIWVEATTPGATTWSIYSLQTDFEVL